MKESLSLSIPSSPKYLALVRSVTAAMAGMFGMTDRSGEEVKLAVDEACANVIKHAYQGDSNRKIRVNYILDHSFTVVIEDNGIKARPESMAGRDLDDLRPGGLGLHFIRRAFDVFALDPGKKRGNRLSLIRYRRADDEDRDRGE
jgi:anti-sigma regulatory factor (Ser/Thr protein kinase)